MNQLQIQSEASADASKAAAWYESQRSGLGIEFVLELDAALARAADTPESYAKRYRNARRVLLRRFPYAIYFLHEGDVVEVLAVLHQRSDSLTWQGRLS